MTLAKPPLSELASCRGRASACWGYGRNGSLP